MKKKARQWRKVWRRWRWKKRKQWRLGEQKGASSYLWSYFNICTDLKWESETKQTIAVLPCENCHYCVEIYFAKIDYFVCNTQTNWWKKTPISYVIVWRWRTSYYDSINKNVLYINFKLALPSRVQTPPMMMASSLLRLDHRSPILKALEIKIKAGILPIPRHSYLAHEWMHWWQ